MEVRAYYNLVHVKEGVRDLGKTKSAMQKAAKEARKIAEMKGKQMKEVLSLAMMQLFTKLLDEDSIEANTIDDTDSGWNEDRADCRLFAVFLLVTYNNTQSAHTSAVVLVWASTQQRTATAAKEPC